MRIVLRCDGDAATGVGHVVRSLALAEEASARGHEVSLMGRLEGQFLTDLVGRVGGLEALGPAPTDPRAATELLGEFDWVHIDSYRADELRDLLMAASGRPHVSLTHDGPFGHGPADLAIDPTPGAEDSDEPRDSAWSQRGSRHTAIRPSILGDIQARPAGHGDLAVLVVLGGTDPNATAPDVVRALLATGETLRVTVVATPRTEAALGKLATENPGSVRVTGPLPELGSAIADSDVVVTAAGSTVWEVCAIGRPMAVVLAADNQLAGYTELLERGAAIGLGTTADVADTAATSRQLVPLLRDPGMRAELARAAHGVVDGRGAWRTVSAWEVIAAGASATGPRGGVHARPVGMEDARTLWNWRNDPSTRAMSRNGGEIPYAAHVDWVQSSLGRSERHLFIAHDDHGDVGTVRWDRHAPHEWEVSITVAPERRGQGLGRSLLSAGESALLRTVGTDVLRFLAVVHEENEASRRLFVRSGYLPDLPPDAEGFGSWSKLA